MWNLVPSVTWMTITLFFFVLTESSLKVDVTVPVTICGSVFWCISQHPKYFKFQLIMKVGRCKCAHIREAMFPLPTSRASCVSTQLHYCNIKKLVSIWDVQQKQWYVIQFICGREGMYCKQFSIFQLCIKVLKRTKASTFPHWGEWYTLVSKGTTTARCVAEVFVYSHHSRQPVVYWCRLLDVIDDNSYTTIWHHVHLPKLKPYQCLSSPWDVFNQHDTALLYTRLTQVWMPWNQESFSGVFSITQDSLCRYR